MTTRNRTKDVATTELVEIPPVNTTAIAPPEFLRLPKPGLLCPFTGLSRSYLNSLVLPNDINGHKPPVKSFCIRQRGAKTGVRLVDFQSLRDFIRAHAECSAEKENGS